MTEKTSLYRHFNADGELLYVGISLNHLIRLYQHSNASPWFDEISNISVEHFPSREEAVQAELTAIKKEKPKHNKAHSDRSALAAQELLSVIGDTPPELVGQWVLSLAKMEGSEAFNPLFEALMVQLNKAKNRSNSDKLIDNPETVRRWTRNGWQGLDPEGKS